MLRHSDITDKDQQRVSQILKDNHYLVKKQCIETMYDYTDEHNTAVGLGNLGVGKKRKESGVGEAVRSPELETRKHDCTSDRPLVP